MWAFLCIVFATNMVGGRFLPRLESGLLCFHVVGFFGIMIPLVIKAHPKPKEQVFEEFLNGGSFPSQGLSWFVGLSGATFAFGGGDAAVHVSEEIKFGYLEEVLTKTSSWLKNVQMLQRQFQKR